jgi:hypothetical protein
LAGACADEHLNVASASTEKINNTPAFQELRCPVTIASFLLISKFWLFSERCSNPQGAATGNAGRHPVKVDRFRKVIFAPKMNPL